MTSLATTMEQVLAARVKLAQWLGEHGEQNDKYMPLLDVLDQLDAALKPRSTD